MRTIVWFRGKDLRLADHEPLRSAAARGEVLPLFVLDPFFFSPSAARELPHRMQFLLESLAELRADLEVLGSSLLLARGRSVDVVPYLAKLWQADAVVAHRWTEPFGRVRDERVRRRLGVPFTLFEGETLATPGTVLTGGKRPFSVYTPFANAFRRGIDVSTPVSAPERLPALPAITKTLGEVGTGALGEVDLASLGLRHNPRLQAGGERAAKNRLERFTAKQLAVYDQNRDRLDADATSRLSADLKFGTLSVRQLWHAVAASEVPAPEARDKFLSELLWREFNYHSVWHRPTLLQQPFRRQFQDFPWKAGEGLQWDAWTAGQTGYPVVDAAARQLLLEGYVHNRARMIAASFLTKHLLIHYKAGEAHYLKYLTDGDWVQNNAGWQWSAGCGCDAQPYFRVFNPVTQGKKFDPAGAYVKKYVPELAELDTKFVHQPWAAPTPALRRAGIVLGQTYPLPVVAHDTARKRYLAIAETTVSSQRSSWPRQRRAP